MQSRGFNLAGGAFVALVLGAMITLGAQTTFARDFYVPCSQLKGKAKSSCNSWCASCSDGQKSRDCDKLLRDFRQAVGSPTAYPGCY
jgi:hypothetical protein